MSFDFEDYLYQQLYTDGLKIEIAKEHSFKTPEDQDTMLVVIKRLTGTYLGNILSQPVQIFIYSNINNMQVAFNLLDSFAKSHNNIQFKVDGLLLKFNFDSPVALRNFINAEEGYRASVYCYGIYVTCENLQDIDSIYMDTDDNEWIPVPFLSASLAYSAVLNTTKISGQELSTSIKQEAGLGLTLTVIATDDNPLVHDALILMMGLSSGNKEFKLRISFINDLYVGQQPEDITKIFKLSEVAFSTDKQKAPSLNLTLKV